jgi:hypothetical protein
MSKRRNWSRLAILVLTLGLLAIGVAPFGDQDD